MKTSNTKLALILQRIKEQNKTRRDNQAYDKVLDSLHIHKALEVRLWVK